jgi:transposase
MPPQLPDSMPWQIYQAYLVGPSARLRLFEEAFGHTALSGPPDPDQQLRTIEGLSEQLTHLTAQIERLQAENSELHFRHFQLLRRNSELEAQLTKDSHNSSRPPSTDPAWAKRTKSLRRPSGRRAGGQAGHRGAWLRMSARPDRIVEHRPPECRRCHAPLAQEPIIRHLKQQVVDIVPARLRVTEHRLCVMRCAACGETTQGEFPAAVRSGVQYGPGVKARVLYLQQYQLLPYQRTSEAMRDLFNCSLTVGTIANPVCECSAALVETELKIKHRLRRSIVIHADEMGLRVAKEGHYIHVASNAALTHYGYDSRRGRGAMDEIGILPKYRGHLVHDGWWSYDYYTACRHSLCGVHLLRELTFFAELSKEQKAWAAPLRELLLEIKGRVAELRASGQQALGRDEPAAFSERYEALLRKGLKENEPRSGSEAPIMVDLAAPPASCQKQARNLLLRMQRKKAEVLRLMTNFRVPFDHNQAERDIRMVKVQQKIGGCFRSESGARQFCRIRSYLSTMRKQDRGILQALEGACRGVPLSPRKRCG